MRIRMIRSMGNLQWNLTRRNQFRSQPDPHQPNGTNIKLAPFGNAVKGNMTRYIDVFNVRGVGWCLTCITWRHISKAIISCQTPIESTGERPQKGYRLTHIHVTLRPVRRTHQWVQSIPPLFSMREYPACWRGKLHHDAWPDFGVTPIFVYCPDYSMAASSMLVQAAFSEWSRQRFLLDMISV